MKPKIICIIPARGGSKGLKNKNILKLNKLPLIAYPIKAAKASRYIDNIIVTTDSKKIAEISKKYGAEIPFLRPKKISQDRSTTEETLRHALLSYEKKTGIKFDICVFLTCTDIFRKISWIDEVILNLIKNPKIESSFVANSTHKNYWYKEKNIKNKRVLRSMKNYSSRQEKKPIFREDTGLASASRAHLWRKGVRIGNNVKIIINDNFETSIDIHSEFDFYLTEKVIEYFKKNDRTRLPNSK